MSRDSFDLGDVFWAPDPYRAGTDPRPWLVLAAETLPYAGQLPTAEAVGLPVDIQSWRSNVGVEPRHRIPDIKAS